MAQDKATGSAKMSGGELAELVKQGIKTGLPLLKLIAARTSTKADDALVEFLEKFVSGTEEQRAAALSLFG